jgi:phosphatidylglycerophosphatase A
VSAASRLRTGLALAIGTGLGTGFSPVASGTAGSALGVLLFVPLAAAGPAALAAAVCTALVAGTWAAGVCGARWGEHDHRRIVIDEIAGQLIALATFPATAGWLLAGFLLFRLYDIIKPFPARHIDRTWRSALGVMTDDVVAGIYANLTLQAVRALWLR